MRIVSLLPSATEIVAVIGAEQNLVGRSHECDFPHTVRNVPALTEPKTTFSSSAEVDEAVRASLNSGESLYRLDEQRLHDLAPDLIITQDLCSVCSIDLNAVRRVAEEMANRPRILSLNPQTFEDVLDDVLRVGEAAGKLERAEQQVVALRERFFQAADFVNAFTAPIPTLFLEWTDPMFAAGHWTAQLVERAGGVNLLNPTEAMEGAGSGAGGQMAHRRAGKGRRVNSDEVMQSRPEAVVVCPCGLSLELAEREFRALSEQDWWRELPAARSGRIAIVDGNHMFNRPGPRLVDAYRWLTGWLNDRPELVPAGFPWRRSNGG